jgi:hypothetical protein
MASTPFVAIEAADGARVAFTFGADIDTTNHRIVVDRFEQGNTIDYTVTSTRGITFTVAPPPTAKIWLFNGVAGVTQATSLPSWATVASVISDAAIELGLVKTDIDDPFASTDANILQLLRLLKSGCRDIVQHRLWTHLDKEFTFNLVATQQAYALPSDYRSMVDDSAWDRTTRFPLSGPMSPKDWQYLQAVPVASSVEYRSRVWQGQLFVTPTPAATDLMAFEYNSSSFIKPVGQTFPTSDTPTVATDIVCFSARLVVARLKRDFRRNKKQDSQAEEDDYQTALADSENEDAQGRTIYLGGSIGRTPRRIDRWNLPDVIR